MNLGKKIRTGTKWLALGNTGIRIFQFCFGIILARLLFPEDFGLMVTVGIFTGFVTMITTAGLGQSLIRAKDVTEVDFHSVFTIQMTAGILVYIAFFLSAPWLAEFFNNPIYKDLIRTTTIIFLLRPFRNMHFAWLNREMQFKKRAIILFKTSLLTGISSVLMAYFGMGVWSLVYSGLLGAISQNILFARATPLRFGMNLEFAVMRKHTKFGSKIVANELLNYVRNQSTNLIVSKIAGPSFLGLLNKANSLHRTPYRMFGQPVAQPVFRAMSKVQDDLDQTKYLYYRTVALLMVYVMPLFVGLWWIADPFVSLLYGDKWIDAIEPLRILTISGFFYIIQRPSGVLLMAQDRLVQEMVLHAVVTIIAVCACFIGLQWGLEGVAWGIVATQIISTCYFYVLVCRTIPTGIMDLFKAISPGVQLNSILFLVLTVTHFLSNELDMEHPVLYLFLMGFLGAISYTAAFLLIRFPSMASERLRWIELITHGLGFANRLLTRA